MGYGDEIMGAGLARGAAKFGKRVAFGNGERIIWHVNAHEIFRGNPNVAPPGSESVGRAAGNLEWIIHYPGRRAYCRLHVNNRWIFNPGFKAIPGEIFLTDQEREWAKSFGDADVIIEPNVKHRAPNKQWPLTRYQAVADHLGKLGLDVAQFAGHNHLRGVRSITAPSFRHACAALERAQFFIGPEGGLHHAAAALNVRAIVLFGGYISPTVTGYDMHVNLFTGQNLGCGVLAPCEHCKKAMERITMEEVIGHADRLLANAEHV